MPARSVNSHVIKRRRIEFNQHRLRAGARRSSDFAPLKLHLDATTSESAHAPKKIAHQLALDVVERGNGEVG